MISIKDYFQIINKNGILLLYMVQDFLDYSWIINNNLQLKPTTFTILPLVNQVIDLYEG
jgi:signal transduction histidine kinase